MTTGGGSPRVKSADRTVELLELLAVSTERRTLGDLARHLGVPKSSMHALLRTLVARGWVETDGTGFHYGLGLQTLRTGSAYLRTDRCVQRLTPVVDRLHHDLDATVRLGRVVDGQVVCLVAREKAPSAPTAGARWSAPAHRTALGKAVLARTAGRGSPAPTPCASTPLTDHDPLREDLARTRARGYAVERERTDAGLAWCVAVGAPPKLGPYDAIGVSVPVGQLPEARAREIAAAISTAMVAGLTGRL